MLKFLAFTFFGAALLISIGILSKNIFHKHQPSLDSDSDKADLASLRNLAGPELKDDYMKEDYFLARFLQPLAKYSGRVPAALEDLRKHLQWRDEQNISTILQEDWSDMQAKFPVTNGTFDLTGKPIFYFDLGEYNVANFLAEGGSPERFLRYILKVLEESDVHVRQLRSQGKDVSKYVWILNLIDYNITRHACVQCLQLYHSVARILIPNYPSLYHLYSYSLGRFQPEHFATTTEFNYFEGRNKVFHSICGEGKDETRETYIFYRQDPDWRQSGCWFMLEKLFHPDQFPAWVNAMN